MLRPRRSSDDDGREKKRARNNDNSSSEASDEDAMSIDKDVEKEFRRSKKQERDRERMRQKRRALKKEESKAIAKATFDIAHSEDDIDVIRIDEDNSIDNSKVVVALHARDVMELVAAGNPAVNQVLLHNIGAQHSDELQQETKQRMDEVEQQRIIIDLTGDLSDIDDEKGQQLSPDVRIDYEAEVGKLLDVLIRRQTNWNTLDEVEDHEKSRVEQFTREELERLEFLLAHVHHSSLDLLWHAIQTIDANAVALVLQRRKSWQRTRMDEEDVNHWLSRLNLKAMDTFPQQFYRHFAKILQLCSEHGVEIDVKLLRFVSGDLEALKIFWRQHREEDLLAHLHEHPLLFWIGASKLSYEHVVEVVQFLLKGGYRFTKEDFDAITNVIRGWQHYPSLHPVRLPAGDDPLLTLNTLTEALKDLEETKKTKADIQRLFPQLHSWAEVKVSSLFNYIGQNHPADDVLKMREWLKDHKNLFKQDAMTKDHFTKHYKPFAAFQEEFAGIGFRISLYRGLAHLDRTKDEELQGHPVIYEKLDPESPLNVAKSLTILVIENFQFPAFMQGSGWGHQLTSLAEQVATKYSLVISSILLQYVHFPFFYVVDARYGYLPYSAAMREAWTPGKMEPQYNVYRFFPQSVNGEFVSAQAIEHVVWCTPLTRCKLFLLQRQKREFRDKRNEDDIPVHEYKESVQLAWALALEVNEFVAHVMTTPLVSENLASFVFDKKLGDCHLAMTLKLELIVDDMALIHRLRRLDAAERALGGVQKQRLRLVVTYMTVRAERDEFNSGIQFGLLKFLTDLGRVWSTPLHLEWAMFALPLEEMWRIYGNEEDKPWPRFKVNGDRVIWNPVERPPRFYDVRGLQYDPATGVPPANWRPDVPGCDNMDKEDKIKIWEDMSEKKRERLPWQQLLARDEFEIDI